MRSVVHLPESSSIRANPWHSYTQLSVHLIDRARKARQEAVQHRGFKVGAAALASSIDGKMGVLTSANYMPVKGGPKICAERALINIARLEAFDWIIGMTVSGPVQPDKHSGRETPTLHPCGDCRTLLGESELITDQTLIMPVHPEDAIYELYNRVELAGKHQGPGGEAEPFVSYMDQEFSNLMAAPERLARLQLQASSEAGRLIPLNDRMTRMAMTGIAA